MNKFILIATFSFSSMLLASQTRIQNSDSYSSLDSSFKRQEIGTDKESGNYAKPVNGKVVREQGVNANNSKNASTKPVDKDNAHGKTEISSEKTILNSNGRQARPIEINEKSVVSDEKQNTEQKINSGTRVNNVNTNEQKLQKANVPNPEK
jgi:hypothetical protein